VHKHASIEVYPNFAEFDITPIDSVVTGRPYEQTELPQRVAPKIGLSEIETHCAFALVGLRLVAKDVLTKLDGNKDGCLTLRELQKALQQLGIDPTDDVTEMLIAKYDTHHNGQLDLNEFMHKLSPYMGLSDANLARMNLARKNPMGPMPKERQLAGAAAAPAKGAAAPSPAKAESHGSHGPHGSHGASASSASANFASPARAGAGAGAGDADTIATANLDLSSTHAKMRKVLGRSMAAVLAEVKRKGSSGGGSGAVSGDAFRDVLASAGVPLTSKEVRALSLKYGAGNGSLQVDEIWRETFTSPAKVAADRKAAATKH
jgi:Ca2+-binding EF-hand superfamily protein